MRFFRVLLVVLATLTGMTGLAFADGEAPSTEKAKELKILVDDAAELIHQIGKIAAFAEFRSKGSRWFHDDVYIFADEFDGVVILNPAKPELEGKNLLDAQDRRGKAFNRVMREMAERQESGWVDYYWPKPGESAPSHKWSYIRKVVVDGKPAFLGAGIYIDE